MGLHWAWPVPRPQEPAGPCGGAEAASPPARAALLSLGCRPGSQASSEPQAPDRGRRRLWWAVSLLLTRHHVPWAGSAGRGGGGGGLSRCLGGGCLTA